METDAWTDGNSIHGDCRTSQVGPEPILRLPSDGTGQHTRGQLSEYWSEKPLPPMPKSWFEEEGGCFSVFGRADGELDSDECGLGLFRRCLVVAPSQLYSSSSIRLSFRNAFFAFGRD